MTHMYRSAQLWAGLALITTLLAGCPSPEPSPCEQNPASCMDGGMCTPTGAESIAAGNCNDGIDNDCDGNPDAADSACAGSCVPSGTESSNNGNTCSDDVDNDCDGYTDGADSACGSTCPGFALETNMSLCTDGIDNDCNGMKDNMLPNMDPNCEPMSCTPGDRPGNVGDPLEALHRPGQCYDDSWVDDTSGGGWTYEMIMADTTKTWTCCLPGNTGCFTSDMNFSVSANAGYESETTFVSGAAFVLESNRTIVRYSSSGPSYVGVFNAAGDTLTLTVTNGTTSTYTCL